MNGERGIRLFAAHGLRFWCNRETKDARDPWIRVFVANVGQGVFLRNSLIRCRLTRSLIRTKAGLFDHPGPAAPSASCAFMSPVTGLLPEKSAIGRSFE